MIALNLTYFLIDARKYWQLLISNERHCVLAILATRIFTIVPQAAEEERIFSCLSLNNTQTRSCLAVPTLEKIYQIKNFLQRKKSRSSNHALQYNEEDIAIMEESVDNDTPIVNTAEMSDMVEVLQGDRQQQTEVDLEDLEIYFQDIVEDLATENATFDGLRAMFSFEHPIFSNGSSNSEAVANQGRLPTLQDFQSEE
jgi:hypothetical protein